MNLAEVCQCITIIKLPLGMIFQAIKGSEASSQLQWFTNDKIEIYFLNFFVYLGCSCRDIQQIEKDITLKVFGNSDFVLSA